MQTKKRETILVIEDDHDIREVIEYNLGREGYRVHSAADGVEGISRARKDVPDLVLLDLMLPGIDGVELCRRLKQDPVTHGIAIVMVTAKSEESDVILGLGVGADDYVSKPFSPKTLLARVEAVLRRGPLKDMRGASERVVRDALVIDAGRHEVLVDGKPVDFTPHRVPSSPVPCFAPGARLHTRQLAQPGHWRDRDRARPEHRRPRARGSPEARQVQRSHPDRAKHRLPVPGLTGIGWRCCAR